MDIVKKVFDILSHNTVYYSKTKKKLATVERISPREELPEDLDFREIIFNKQPIASFGKLYISEEIIKGGGIVNL